MSLAKLNGFDVLTMQLTRSKFGRAVLECVLADSLPDTKLEKSTPVILDLAGFAGVFTGNVWRIGRAGGATSVIALEGLGLNKVLEGKFYENTQAGLVGIDILRDCGLGGEVQISGQFDKYTRLGGAAYIALTELARATNATWRTVPDGGVLIRGNGLSQIRLEQPLEWGEDLIGFDPDDLEYTCLIRPDLQPDMFVRVEPYGEARDVTIERIMHTIQDGAARTCFWGNV
jgi:hypothetical protein